MGKYSSLSSPGAPMTSRDLGENQAPITVHITFSSQHILLRGLVARAASSQHVQNISALVDREIAAVPHVISLCIKPITHQNPVTSCKWLDHWQKDLKTWKTHRFVCETDIIYQNQNSSDQAIKFSNEILLGASADVDHRFFMIVNELPESFFCCIKLLYLLKLLLLNRLHNTRPAVWQLSDEDNLWSYAIDTYLKYI